MNNVSRRMVNAIEVTEDKTLYVSDIYRDILKSKWSVRKLYSLYNCYHILTYRHDVKFDFNQRVKYIVKGITGHIRGRRVRKYMLVPMKDKKYDV